MRSALLPAVAAALLVIGAAPLAAGEAKEEIIEREWFLISFQTAGASEPRAVPPLFSMNIDRDGASGGYSVCNEWRGEAEFRDNDRLRFREMREPRALCRTDDPMVATVERRYTPRLAQMELRYHMDGDILVVEFNDGETWTFEALNE